MTAIAAKQSFIAVKRQTVPHPQQSFICSRSCHSKDKSGTRVLGLLASGPLDRAIERRVAPASKANSAENGLTSDYDSANAAFTLARRVNSIVNGE
jgi:hypothetical protein